MRRALSRVGLRLGLGATAAFLIALATAAAFFASTGHGTASATVGSLSAPSITSTSPGAGTVQISWSTATPPPGGGSVSYYVSRNGASAGGNCPTSTSPTGVTSCTDSGLSKGSYNYTVTAVWRSWSATSAVQAVNVSFGAVSQLVFSTQPDGSPTGGVAFPQQPVVTAEDSGGNTVTSYSGTVSLSIKSGSGTSGATLSGCSGVLNNGVTTFSGCKIDKAGTSYQLNAGDGTLTTTSSTFNVTAGPATQLVFSTQPDGSPTGGVAFPQQPVITARDAGGNIATGYAGTVTLSIKSGTGTTGAALSGCAGSLTSGVTTFSGCKIDKAGSGYQLNAGDGTLSATSNAFNVAVGPASQLVFTTQPDGSPTGGIAFPQQPVVTAKDAGGNIATGYSGTVTLSIKAGTGTGGAVLGGCSGVLNNGVTTFSGCKIDKAGTGYVLNAGDGALNSISNAFNVGVGPVSQLVFSTQPDGSPTGGVSFPQQPVVTAEDAGGNTVTTYSGTVSLSIKSGTGTSGATLSGCTGSPTNGVTSFSGCKIDKAGTGYQLNAGDGTLSTTSNAFNVAVGPASQLVFTTQPDGSANAGSPFPTQPVVTAEDAGGNAVTSYSKTVTLSIKSGTGTSGATLSGCSGVLVSGVTTFSGCTIDKGGTGYQLNVADGTLTGTSAPFTISQSVSVSVLGQGATNSNTISNVKSTSGATDLIVAYCEGSPNCSSQTATVGTGAGTPFSSASAATIAPIVNSGGTKDCLEIIQAVGNGNTGSVTVTDGSNGNAVWVDVLQLSSGATVHGTPQFGGGTGTAATASLGSPSQSEVALVAMNDTSGTATITPPSGMTALGSYQHTDGSIDADLGMYFDPTAQSSAAFTLSASLQWATIAAIVG